MVKKIPAVRRKIEEEMSKARHDINQSMDQATGGATYIQRLPLEGLAEVRTKLWSEY
jgi:hypothetical protein